VPATAEPLIRRTLSGSTEFQECDVGAPLGVQARPERRYPRDGLNASALLLGTEMDAISIHLAVDQCLAAFEMVYPDKADAVEVADFVARETLAHSSIRLAEMQLPELRATRCASVPAHLLAIHIGPIIAAACRSQRLWQHAWHLGLPLSWQLKIYSMKGLRRVSRFAETV